jgi:hypothetical protein
MRTEPLLPTNAVFGVPQEEIGTLQFLVSLGSRVRSRVLRRTMVAERFWRGGIKGVLNDGFITTLTGPEIPIQSRR